MKIVNISPDSMKLVGRTYIAKNRLYPIHSGSGCEFHFTGTKLEIILSCSDSENSGIPYCNRPRIAVTVNGRFVIKKVIEYTDERYTIISSGSKISADIAIIKLSEAAFSIGNVSFEADDNSVIEPLPTAGKRIEFIGDSITCGYGIDDSNIDSEFATEAENFMKSYAYRTAHILGMEQSVFAYSGHGVISGYTGDGVRNTNEILPPYYESLGKSYDTVNGRKISDIPWDFDLMPSDVVVVNLGTNDSSFCIVNDGAYDEFEAAYTAFLRNVRKCNPSAWLILCMNIIGNDMFPHICSAAHKLISEGDSRILTFRFTPQNGMLGYGSKWHPSEDTQAYAAEELAEFIRCNIK